MNKEKSTARKELEADVAAFDKVFKPIVRTMDTILLLRKCHPLYRTEHARRLKTSGDITEQEMKEFTGNKVFELSKYEL